MNLMGRGVLVAGIFIAGAAVLAGCTSSPARLQDVPPADRVTLGPQSWISPGAAGKNLLYVSNREDVKVYAYETNAQVGDLNYFSDASGSCTDSLGDVFITNYGAASVLEFAHGGTKPVKTFIDPSPYPIDCSVDPKSGDLAVVNQYGQSEYSPGNVAIYAGSKGKPKKYESKVISKYISASYDDRGNLLVSGYESSATELSFAVLDQGSSRFETVALPHSGQWRGPGNIRWDGEYFDVEFEVPYSENPTIFMWYTIEGKKGTQEGYMETEESGTGAGPFWLGRIGGPRSVKRANQLVAEVPSYGSILYWNYPEGGADIFDMYDVANGVGVTVSPGK